ncbi:MAG: hypothetical protein H6738_21845 [Alphaproteobacteria bacterium]|nr:hypothetical protein [Alphaproteobacteria bacterium]MCB9699441.1 hypothetical protein [Alphaproteobacteria bacterium]
MMERDRASGHPSWEQRQAAGLPRLEEQAQETEGREEQTRPVAHWLGWAPTSWRARGGR